MAESRLVPTNLMSWPKVRDLLPDQKLIVYHLWVNRYTEACGCYLMPLNAFAAEISVQEAALGQALVKFKDSRLVDLDEETGEILILDWYRWHKFNSPRQRRQADQSINKILSDRLREKTVELLQAAIKKQENKSETNKNNHLPPNTTQLNLTQLNTTHNDVCGITGLTDGVCQIFHAAVSTGKILDKNAYLKSLIPNFKGIIRDADVQSALDRGKSLVNQEVGRKKIHDELKRQEIFLKQGDAEAASKIKFLRNRLDQSA